MNLKFQETHPWHISLDLNMKRPFFSLIYPIWFLFLIYISAENYYDNYQYSSRNVCTAELKK